MKTLTQTIIVIVALNLLTAGFTSAGNVSDGGGRDEFEMQAGQAEVTAVLAQVQASGPAAPVPPSISSPPTPPAPVPVSAVNNNLYLTRGLSYGSRSGSTGTILVIPSGQTNTEDLLTINEDMSVMSRIFEKNLEQTHLTTAHNNIFLSRQDAFATFFGGGRGGIQSMYLQGYGALFLMKVDFPLTPSTEIQDEEKETQKAEEGDPVWQEMRREIYEPQKVDRRSRTDQPEQKYEAEKVENLKTILIKALKHAVNIRSLKPDESVILTVTGRAGSSGTNIRTVIVKGENRVIVQEQDAHGVKRTRVVPGTSIADIGLSSPTILVIRAKRSDIDDFVKGDLNFDKFRERVKILTCPLLGGAVGSSGFNPYGSSY